MDPNCVMLRIMTDIKSPRGGIAANFQNAIAAVQPLPPIGVFWDIENIQVPKGKAASSVVSAIRHKFFRNHREAEFMCVCDINKESKAIVHELNDAQVTVVHIDATSKNAADEKLRQCMRRFVDTHGSPSTILLISDDVNFATDLSDFRHRHQVRVILLHRNNAPEPLLACANQHYNFTELTEDLPLRSPVKQPNNRPRDVIVTNLPPNFNYAVLKKHLRRLSDNCGGKVKRISKTEAIVSFTNPDLAERAQKRMDKEIICGQKIMVNFLPRDGKDWTECSSRRTLFKETDQSCCSSSSTSSRDSSPQNTRLEKEKKDNEKASERGKKPFAFPPPPVLDGSNLPTALKSPVMSRAALGAAASQMVPADKPPAPSLRFESLNSQNMPLRLMQKCGVTSNGAVSKQIQDSCKIRPLVENTDALAGACKNVGKVSPFFMQKNCTQSDWKQYDTLRAQQTHSSVLPNYGVHVDAFAQRNCFQPIRNHHYGQGLGLGPRSCEYNSPSSYDPINTGRANQPLAPVASTSLCSDFSPVELVITNLDQGIEVNEMKSILQSVFREHVMVLHISMIYQPDGSPKAIVKVPSVQDAQLAIANIQRRKIGHKRIQISYAFNDRAPPFHVLKSEVVSLLKDIPIKCLPVFKFRELYESRYHRAISVSDLNKMRDVIQIQDNPCGRVISLSCDFHSTPSPTESDSSQELAPLEKPYCELHFRPIVAEGWAEQESLPELPDVIISLRTLSLAVHTLLDSHRGSLPLISFCACYEADIGPLPVASCSSEDSIGSVNPCLSSMTKNHTSPVPKGVPLEHLITCIAGVEIVKSKLCVKRVQWCENKLLSSQVRSISPALAGTLTAFGRELVELLKNQPRSIVPFSKFIPVYHHHFGKQCRVSDYGFTKLIDLLEALPHIIQVLGEGQNRQITLTHRAQVKRFINDLMRILKSHSIKQIPLLELPVIYEQCLEKSFSVINYGVCFVEDLLIEVPDNTVVVTSVDEEKVVSLPKRDQTPEEMERVKKFSEDVIELFKHTATCSMAFNKFIPSYHHHFGKQCRVADYGFIKLIELFEATNIVEVTGSGEDKIVSLIEEERNKIIAERLTAVLRAQPNNMIALHMLGSAYIEMHGHVLRPADYGAVDMPDLLRKLTTSLRVVEGYAGSVVTLMDQTFVSQASLRTRRILMEQPNGELPLNEVNRLYQKRYGHVIDLSVFQQELKDVVKVESGILKLLPLQLLARDMMILLEEHEKPIPFQDFHNAFQKKFKAPLQPSRYGFNSLISLLSSLSEYFSIKGCREKRTVNINKDMCGSPLRLSQDPQSPQGLSSPPVCENMQNAVPAATTSGVFCAPFLNCFPPMSWSSGLPETRSGANDMLGKSNSGFQKKDSSGQVTGPPCNHLGVSYGPFAHPLLAASFLQDQKVFPSMYGSVLPTQTTTISPYCPSAPVCSQHAPLSSAGLSALFKQSSEIQKKVSAATSTTMLSSSGEVHPEAGTVTSGSSDGTSKAAERQASLDVSTQTAKSPADRQDSTTENGGLPSPTRPPKKACATRRIAASFSVPLD